MRISDWSSDVCSSDLVLQRLHHLLALLLLDVAVDGGGGQAACGQLFGQLLGAELGPREHQHPVVGLGLENAGQRVELVDPADHPVALADVARGGGRRLDRDLHRVLQVGLRDALDLRRHRRSEEHTSELQSLMRISYAVFCLKNKKQYILDKTYSTV